MHKVDLSKYNLRTDLVIEQCNDSIKKNNYKIKGINIDDIILDKDNSLKKKKGRYITISFNDITDTTNFDSVLEIFVNELKELLKYSKIKSDDTCLVVGLGNANSTPDSLGEKTLKNTIVTRHLYLINDVDKKYRNVSALMPGVMGNTGIETRDVIKGVIAEIKPDFIIIIDSLCASSIERINNTIQLTDTGIFPGSGIGNNRHELSSDTLNTKVIAIGVPTVVDSAVIVSDTIKYLIKKIGYTKNNINNNIDKLKPINKINYLNSNNDLTNSEKKELLGYLGTLNDSELKQLVFEVLSPINSNMIVTTKEIDFIVEKLGLLLGKGINKSLHNI